MDVLGATRRPPPRSHDWPRWSPYRAPARWSWAGPGRSASVRRRCSRARARTRSCAPGLSSARRARERLKTTFGVDVTPCQAWDEAGATKALEDADICLAAGAAGVKLVSRAVWARHPRLKALADVNAVPPLGIEGIEATDKGAEREGKRVFGALGIGGLKMKVHRACVAQLFERNDAVIDLEAIYGAARAS